MNAIDEKNSSYDMEKAREVSANTTSKHISRVRELLGMAAKELNERGTCHDMSKHEEVESEPLARMCLTVMREGNVPYGSEEYKKRTAMLGPMLEHHYANNSHHPEHYDEGVDGMDLFDVVEMFFDWKAASERGDESHMSISKACEKYSVSPQLEHIFKNTADRMGFNYK